MARSRNIKPGFFKNDELAEIEPLGRILFAGLWCMADREGRLKDRPKRIKAETLPYDDCDIKELLQALANKGFILRYEIDGEGYIQIQNWHKHQRPHVKEVPSEIPPPEGNDKAPEIPGLAPEKPEPAPNQHLTDPPDSLFLDSLNLIPDSLNKGTSQEIYQSIVKESAHKFTKHINTIEGTEQKQQLDTLVQAYNACNPIQHKQFKVGGTIKTRQVFEEAIKSGLSPRLLLVEVLYDQEEHEPKPWDIVNAISTQKGLQQTIAYTCYDLDCRGPT